MGVQKLGALALVFVFMLNTSGCFYGMVSAKYDTGAGVVPGKLNVHLVPHTHDDVGWLKTVDQYYVGSNISIQFSCVENVLDSVMESLRRDPNRKFVYAEMAFFQRWWGKQSPEIQEETKKLVDAGQLEFINGGWCMHDEAAAHYIDMIDQTTLGHRFIKENFNKAPRAGWQIDPFGHSAVQAYLLGVELGFDSLHFARIDYQDKAQRKGDKSLEVIWHGSKTFGSSSQIFTNAFPEHYTPPSDFHFEVYGDYEPIQDDPLVFNSNVEQRVKDFVNVSLTQANVTRGNHIMWPMGDDFQYQYAETWFKQMDKLIHHVNKLKLLCEGPFFHGDYKPKPPYISCSSQNSDGRVNALYSTPSIYADAKNAENEMWPLKTDDYFPYADRENAYWTGYFSSRPGLKGYIRMLSGYYLAARQLEFMAGKRINGPNTYSLEDAMGIAQHHDAVTGTAKQHTTDDYARRLAIGQSESEAVINSALSCLTSNKPRSQCSMDAPTLTQCQLLNISYCPPAEENIPDGKSLVLVAYNPLGWSRIEYIRIPVNEVDLKVRDSSGNTIEAQYIGLDNVTSNLRNFYTELYLGFSPKTVPKYWLVFQVSVPPLGWNTYFISKNSVKGSRRMGFVSLAGNPPSDTIDIGPGNLKMSFSSSSGQLQRMFNSKTGVDVPVQQTYLWYGSTASGAQPSGAYIFRPDVSPARNFSTPVPLNVIRGPVVDEVHQQFSPWIYQVTRLYRDKEHAEVEFTIGPITPEGYEGKEVITRMTTNMATDKVFYTDSNGRDFLKRVRDYRADWNLSVNEPVAGNYYPLSLGIFIRDNNSEFSVLVDRATGGSSITDGEVEIMLHRCLVYDDGRGVGEPLNEEVSTGEKREGLTIRGKYHMNINRVGDGARWRRTTGQEIYSPLLVAFAHGEAEQWRSSHVTKSTTMDPNYSLPQNVALITLQELDDKSVILRLAHLYEAGEDSEHSALARVELKKMFAGKTIKGAKEMSLSTNQDKSEMKKKMTWKVEGVEKEGGPVPVRGGPFSSSTMEVKLAPMEIRTFLLTF